MVNGVDTINRNSLCASIS